MGTSTLFGLVLVVACGPSLRVLHASEVHFEHCYALDEGQQSAELRASCWSDFLDKSSSGETRDRLDYAARRVRALREGDGSIEVQATTLAEAPAPSSAYAPPPAVAASDRLDAAADADAEAPTCVDRCTQAYDACFTACKASPKSRAAKCAACDRDRKKCVQACPPDAGAGDASRDAARDATARD